MFQRHLHYANDAKTFLKHFSDRLSVERDVKLYSLTLSAMYCPLQLLVLTDGAPTLMENMQFLHEFSRFSHGSYTQTLRELRVPIPQQIFAVIVHMKNSKNLLHRPTPVRSGHSSPHPTPKLYNRSYTAGLDD